MGDYLVKLLKKENIILDGKVLVTVLKPVHKLVIKLRKDLFNTQKIPESSLRNAIAKAVGKGSLAGYDYALITDDPGKIEILIPLNAGSSPHLSLLSPRPAILKGIQLLRRQEYVELEANAVFSRSLLNIDVPLGSLGDVYMYEGEVGISSDINNVVAVKLVTDKGTRVVLGNEISRRFEAPKSEGESVKKASRRAVGARASRVKRGKRKSRRRRKSAARRRRKKR